MAADQDENWTWFDRNLGEYVMGRLSATDRARMEAFIAADPEARAALELEICIKDAVCVEAARLEVATRKEGIEARTAGFIRELGIIEPGSPRKGRGEGWANRMRHWLDGIGGMRIAAFATLLLAIQAGVMLMLISSPSEDSTQGFRGVIDRKSAVDFKLYPKPGATMENVSLLLLENGCVFAGGPGEDGAFFIGCSSPSKKPLSVVLNALRAAPEFADVVPMGGQ